MLNKLSQLEKQLEGLSEISQLPQDDLLALPEKLRQVHSYKVFGDDLFAIPANLIIEGDDDEFEMPFSFLDSIDENFESEYRPDVPAEFIHIGYLYHATEIVVLNKLKQTIHIFHASDIADPDWLKYKLEEKKICDLETFIQNLRPQTVCCLTNPKDASQYDIFEIRNNNEIATYNEDIKCPDPKTTWTKLKELTEQSLAKGYELHYAPKKLLVELGI